MYSVYFCWGCGDMVNVRCWHPVGMPNLTRDEAKAAANALKVALPKHAWAFGPTFQEGLVRV